MLFRILDLCVGFTQ